MVVCKENPIQCPIINLKILNTNFYIAVVVTNLRITLKCQ